MWTLTAILVLLTLHLKVFGEQQTSFTIFREDLKKPLKSHLKDSESEYGNSGYPNVGYNNHNPPNSGGDTPATLAEIEESYEDSLLNLKGNSHPGPGGLSPRGIQGSGRGHGPPHSQFRPILGGTGYVHFPRGPPPLGKEYFSLGGPRPPPPPRHPHNFKPHFRPSEPFGHSGPELSSGFKPSFGPPQKGSHHVSVAPPVSVYHEPTRSFDGAYDHFHNNQHSIDLGVLPPQEYFKGAYSSSKEHTLKHLNPETKQEVKVIFIKAPGGTDGKFRIPDANSLQQFLNNNYKSGSNYPKILKHSRLPLNQPLSFHDKLIRTTPTTPLENSFNQFFPMKKYFSPFNKGPYIQKLNSPRVNSEGDILPLNSNPVHKLTELVPSGSGFLMTYAPTFAPVESTVPSYIYKDPSAFGTEVEELLKSYGIPAGEVEVSLGQKDLEDSVDSSSAQIPQNADTEKFTRSASSIKTKGNGTTEIIDEDGNDEGDVVLTVKPVYRIRSTTTLATVAPKSASTTTEVTTPKTTTLSRTTEVPSTQKTRSTTTTTTATQKKGFVVHSKISTTGRSSTTRAPTTTNGTTPTTRITTTTRKVTTHTSRAPKVQKPKSRKGSKSLHLRISVLSEQDGIPPPPPEVELVSKTAELSEEDENLKNEIETVKNAEILKEIVPSKNEPEGEDFEVVTTSSTTTTTTKKPRSKTHISSGIKKTENPIEDFTTTLKPKVRKSSWKESIFKGSLPEIVIKDSNEDKSSSEEESSSEENSKEDSRERIIRKPTQEVIEFEKVFRISTTAEIPKLIEVTPSTTSSTRSTWSKVSKATTTTRRPKTSTTTPPTTTTISATTPPELIDNANTDNSEEEDAENAEEDSEEYSEEVEEPTTTTPTTTTTTTTKRPSKKSKKSKKSNKSSKKTNSVTSSSLSAPVTTSATLPIYFESSRMPQVEYDSSDVAKKDLSISKIPFTLSTTEGPPLEPLEESEISEELLEPLNSKEEVLMEKLLLSSNTNNSTINRIKNRRIRPSLARRLKGKKRIRKVKRPKRNHKKRRHNSHN